MFKSGSICKIIVRNFVTYGYVEMVPGPNLNMLIGPNGTGKSTIVAAIILGLGGNPKTVGRGTKISDYIKHNCTEAAIEIRLLGENLSDQISIIRHFDASEKSVWALNGKKVPFKEIEHVTRQYNIQVDNLCQFLPQDRVQEFAKMNKQQLLQQTQIAICRNDLIDKQLKLIEFRSRHKELLFTAEKYTNKLSDLEAANLRIESKIKNLDKKKKYLRVIEDIDRKIAWVNYQVLKTKVDSTKEDRIQAVNILKQHTEKAAPLERASTNIRSTIRDLQTMVKSKNTEVQHNDSKLQNMIEVNRKTKTSIMNALYDLNSRVRQIDRREQEITELKEQLRSLIENKSQIWEAYGDDTQREQKILAFNTDIKEIYLDMSKITETKGQLSNSKRNIMYELQSSESKLTQLENVKQQRLAWLRQMDNDAYMAVQWLRSNKHMFKGEVYEPMVLELNVLNHQHAIYIENSINLRDRIAFTCALKEDMNLLIQTVKVQKKLRINVLHSGENQPAFHTYQPAIPIEQLKKFGMFAYVHSLVTGPEPIMKFLCKMYNIHNIPVGNEVTNKCFEQVPSKIRKFFTDKYSFSISYSTYTGAKSCRQMEIRSDSSLSIYVDSEQFENVRSQVTEFRNQCDKLNEQIRNLESQIQTLNEKQNNLRNNMREVQKCRQTIQDLDSRIRITNNKLEQLQTESTTKVQIQQEYNARIMVLVNEMVKRQIEIKTLLKMHSNSLIEFKRNQTKLDLNRQQITALEIKFQELRVAQRQAEETINNITITLTNVKNEAKAALTKAKKLSNNCTPLDKGFVEFKEAYNNLSNNLEELDSEKDHVLSKIDCLSTATVNELQEYEARVQQINKLQNDVQQNGVEFNNINSSMSNLHNEWLQPLQEIINQINLKFSDAFKRLGCAGEVTICKGDNEKDYDQYGLSIKVKYRDTEPLQELDSIIQSGGERAVATAAYMLSLQELTPVPFRCVDEINQGMDPNNERRIFEILVDATSQQDTSQYFFITPKLVPNLKFVPSMMVHFVHNGPFCIVPKPP